MLPAVLPLLGFPSLTSRPQLRPSVISTKCRLGSFKNIFIFTVYKYSYHDFGSQNHQQILFFLFFPLYANNHLPSYIWIRN
ncbi:hypothetical protein L6452_33381 [Arctium lappa]|uniref:Uncharacterized protein n=1 Tax=Arctium lappa TaxID=4217 RepID=A0ACB8YFX1_ARCLA|nr:hypothetical protein L6452_33381 [Arctium lappa]